MKSRGLTREESLSAFEPRKLKMEQVQRTDIEQVLLRTPSPAKKVTMGHLSPISTKISLKDLLAEKEAILKKEEELQKEKERLEEAAKTIVLETWKSSNISW
jgi:hypothetical protein